MSQKQPVLALDAAVTDRILTAGDVAAIAEATATKIAEIVSATPATSRWSMPAS